MVLGKRKNTMIEEALKTAAFSKEQLLSCMRYKDRKDLVQALLIDNILYSFDEVDSLINQFMKGKVK